MLGGYVGPNLTPSFTAVHTAYGICNILSTVFTNRLMDWRLRHCVGILHVILTNLCSNDAVRNNNFELARWRHIIISLIASKVIGAAAG